MKLLYKVIDYLDEVLLPYITKSKTYKELKAGIKYEIYPTKPITVRLWVSYEESDYDGFIEFPIINIEFIIGKKVRIRKKNSDCSDIHLIALPSNEKEKFENLLKKGVKKING